MINYHVTISMNVATVTLVVNNAAITYLGNSTARAIMGIDFTMTIPLALTLMNVLFNTSASNNAATLKADISVPVFMATSSTRILNNVWMLTNVSTATETAVRFVLIHQVATTALALSDINCYSMPPVITIVRQTIVANIIVWNGFAKT